MQYSTDGGSSWTNIGSPITATGTVQTFSENVNVTGNVRIRIIHNSGGNTFTDRRMNVDDIVLTDYTAGPTVNVSKSNISGLKYRFGSGPSQIDSFQVNGSNLLEDIKVKAPANFEVSTNPSGPFSDSLFLTATNQTVALTNVYVRLKSGLSTGLYLGQQIDITSQGANPHAVLLDGKVLGLPGFLTGVMINACGQEGRNEFLVIRNESTPLKVNPEDIDIRYGTSSPATTRYTDTFDVSGNQAFIDSLNNKLAGSCDFVFANAPLNSVIPPYRRLIITRFNADFYPNYSNWCGNGLDTVYVAFSRSANWNQTGNFANSSPLNRYFRVIIQEDSVDVFYIPDNLSGADGDFVTFPESGGAANSYGNYPNCEPPLNNIAILPVELLSFNAERRGKEVLLEWTTLSEVNNAYFEIFRSNNATQWALAGTVAGNGNSNTPISYTFSETNLNKGLQYYRLRQTDFDGTQTWHPIRSVDGFESSAEAFVVFPNPASKILYINLPDDTFETKTLSLINIAGALVHQQKIQSGMKVEIAIDMLPAGSYTVVLSSSDGQKAKRLNIVR